MKKLRRILALLLVVTMMAVNVPMVVQAATCTDGHNYQTEVLAPTCTEGGFTIYSCSDCGDSYIADEVDALGHQMVDGICVQCGIYEAAQLVDGVYELYNANHLYWFAQEVNGGNTSINGKLMADITVNTNVLTEDGELNGDGSSFRTWTPIGNDKNEYRGTFDGNGKTVSGLYFNNYSASYVGFFGETYYASIQNLSLKDSYFYGSIRVGGVVGNQYYGKVSNCANSGSVSGYECVGGIVGYQNYGTVSNCANSGSVSDGNCVGGIVGYQYGGTVSNCANSGSVSGSYQFGGIVGYQGYGGEVSNCSNSGSVSGRGNEVGGIVGYQFWGKVSNCSNSGSVSGSYYVGGIVGYQYDGTVSNCSNSGSVSGSGYYVGGIAGYQYDTVSNCYYIYGIVKDGNGTNQFGIGCDTQGSYVRDTSGVTTMKTAAQFASGEVCYLLQQAAPDAGWGQTIGVDASPVLGGEVVYQAFTCKGEARGYNNTTGIIHSFGDDGICSLCKLAGEIIIEMTDPFGDGWGGNMLKIYEDGIFISNAMASDFTYQVKIDYYFGKVYTFTWVQGIYPEERTFTISLNQEVLFKATGADCQSFTNGQTVYTLENPCVHSYEAVTTAPTCTEEGYTTYTCTLCGSSYQDDTVSATGHSYDAVITVPTCTEDGYTTYTCTGCGDSYVDDSVSATGHIFDDWRQDKIPTCDQKGSISRKCLHCEEREYIEVAAFGHDYADGYCTSCGAKDPDFVEVIDPEITMNYPSLSFEDEIFYNVYYTVDDASNIVEMGLITFDSKLADGTIADAVDVIPGYVSGGGKYMVRSNGIPAKNLGDAVYFKVYAKLSDGSYVYSDIAGYHAVAYANTVLNNANSSAKAKALVVAMLNYGAAAQEYFGYKTDSLMNAGLTAEQQALVQAYDSSMVQDVVKADASKVGAFVMNGGYSNIYPTVSFRGAFSINYYFAPNKAVDAGMTFYYWDAATYASVSVLTAENACGVIAMKQDGNSWGAAVEGIAAKQIDETIYVAAIYTSNGVAYPTSVVAYSLGNYCKTIAANGTAFGAATAVYGLYAKAYFN